MSTPPTDPFAALTDSQVMRLQRLYTQLIEDINPRIFYAETRRGSFATAAVAFLAAGFALALGVLANERNISSRAAFWSLLVLGVGLIATGTLVLLVYAGQTNFGYPFKKKTSTWKWFYRDAVPGTSTLRVPWHTRQSAAARAAGEELFDREWEGFVQRHLSLTDVRVNAGQDLQQLYVLHVNEFYKNKFLTQIRKVMSAGLVLTALAATATFAGVWLCNT
jgi:hypothetical protein